MDSCPSNTLSALLAANLSASRLPPVLDAGEACVLLRCTREQIETLAARGEVPAKKYGRGWIFVTVQLLHHVIADCARNLSSLPEMNRAIEAAQQVDERRVARVPEPLPLNPPAEPGKRGRPRREVRIS
jgi:hypothetical protein